MSTEKFKVHLKSVDGYNDLNLDKYVAESLEAIGFKPSNSTKVLVKPNLLCSIKLACTHPQIVRSACNYLQDCGCAIEIADSPGFGRAAAVAKSIGITELLPNGLEVVDMGEKVKFDLKEGGTLGIAKKALEADIILNLPKFKAHRMMRFSASVKNLYGCISGMEKAIQHSKHGDKIHNDVRLFSSLIVDLEEYLPPQVALIDAITSMSESGPMNGTALDLNFIAAGENSIALDTALYAILDKPIELFPIWGELQRRRIPASFQENIDWLGDSKDSIDISKFNLPTKLMSESFSPIFLMKSGLKRILSLFNPKILN